MKILQNDNYFCFGMDSILLANFVESNSSKNVIVDLCTGSGVIAMILSAKTKYKKIYAVELQNEMFELLEENINKNNLSCSIVTIKSDIKDTNYIKRTIIKDQLNDKVDIIVCNPPYKPLGTGVINENEVKYIARHEDKCTLEDVFVSAKKMLNVKGQLYLVYKPERFSDLIEIARKYELEPKKVRLVYPTLDKKPSIVLIKYVKKGGNELIIDKPLIEYKDNGEYTDEILQMYGISKENNFE